jgi:hypothetical protein
MNQSIKIRLSGELHAWLKSISRITGIPMSRLVREQIERAKRETGTKSFMRFSGSIDVSADLSSNKAFSRK